MELFGEFLKAEIDGKSFLVYTQQIKPLPQMHTPIPKIAIHSGHDFLPQPLFFCPVFRAQVARDSLDVDRDPDSEILAKLETSPLFDNTSNGHHVLPLFWCNNKEADPQGKECHCCSLRTIGTDYYFCVECDERFHKECVESPLEISHPSHIKHSLQLHYSYMTDAHCIYCTIRATYIIYYCALCNSYMHPLCAQAKIPIFIDQPKRHDHTLTIFFRHGSLTCNICGLVNKQYLTYVCPSICDFVAHSDCINIPQTIRISRHSHRVSFTSSLPLGKWSCGVCRKEIDSDYGAYTCNKCSDYAVHTRCALRRDISDGIELEGVPEGEDVEPPFERKADGNILHFSHGCHLEFKTYNGVYDPNKFCQACVLPIYEKNFYVCVERCDFILHERCAEAPRKKYHPLHPHPLELKVVHNIYSCHACERRNCLKYACANQDCYYYLDVVCASVSEPFDYQGHPSHPLYLALDPKEKPTCHLCKSTKSFQEVLNCIECDFIICFKCATLPYKVRYKHDEHYLTFCHGDEASPSDWCELCEGKLAKGGEEGFYKCNDCCTTLHINCLLGPDPYLKPGLTYPTKDGELLLLHRNNCASRPICRKCKIRCPYPIYLESRKEMSSTFACSFDHWKFYL